jgi:predicted RNase H-like HicB family nuclease
LTDYAVIYEIADDGTVSAFVPSLSVFSTGVDRTDAETSVREAIQLYLDSVDDGGPDAARVSTGIVSV